MALAADIVGPEKSSLRCYHPIFPLDTGLNVTNDASAQEPNDQHNKLCCSFMFRSKRSALVKRLWRQRIEHTGNDASSCQIKEKVSEDIELQTGVQMLKRLKEVQLESLVAAVESRGADQSGCVLVPKPDLRLGRRSVAPHVLCCQLWRWPEVRQPRELKKLCCCGNETNSIYICCNPFHWSRVYEPDSPPPPYSRRHPQEISDDYASSEAVSQETRGTNYYGSIHSHAFEGSSTRKVSQPWCKIAYWEMSSIVGRLFPVNQQSVNVFADLPHGDGLCLGTLAQSSRSDHKSVLQTRKKIGFGITLSKEGNEVWVYNRSEYPIFVNSPTLDPPNTISLTVYKVQPGFSIKIFDYEVADYNKRMHDPSLFVDGPVDSHAVRISFAKGWGPSNYYSRRFITSCPCWLEVIFIVNR